MGLLSARSGHCTPIFNKSAQMTDKETLEKTLAAVQSRRGLIHGEMVKNKRVCALGALTSKYGDCTVNGILAEQIQEFNDSMPNATPAVRRTKMINWLKEKLKALA